MLPTAPYRGRIPFRWHQPLNRQLTNSFPLSEIMCFGFAPDLRVASPRKEQTSAEFGRRLNTANPTTSLDT